MGNYYKIIIDFALQRSYFEAVILNCAAMERAGQDGTWINSQIIPAYIRLHEMGWAHSVEVWKDKELVGGFYGIMLEKQKVYCGESMFSKVSNASKYGFITFVRHLQSLNFRLIDCQVYTPHLESLGAELIPRNEYLDYLV